MREHLQHSQRLQHTDAGVRRQGQDLLEVGELGQRASGEPDAQLDRVERDGLTPSRLGAALLGVVERPRHPA